MSVPRRDPPAATVPNQGIEYLRPQPLSIAHLMLWTILCAGFFSLDSLLIDVTIATFPPMVDRETTLTLSFAYSVILAAGLTAALILLRDRWLGATGRFQPGHWMVLVLAAATIPGKAFMAWFTISQASGGSSPAGLVYLGSTTIGVALILADLWVMRRPYFPRRWKIAFLGQAIFIGTQTAFQFLSFISWASLAPFGTTAYRLITTGQWFLSDVWWQPALGVLLLVVASMDLRSAVRRDWIHWLGVGLFFCGLVLQFVWFVLIRA